MNTTTHYNNDGKPFYVEIHREAPKDAIEAGYWVQDSPTGDPYEDMSKLGCYVYSANTSMRTIAGLLVLKLSKLPNPLPSFISLRNKTSA